MMPGPHPMLNVDATKQIKISKGTAKKPIISFRVHFDPANSETVGLWNSKPGKKLRQKAFRGQVC